MNLMKPLVRSLLVMLLVVSAVGCTTNQTTGRSQLLFMSWEEEISRGAEAAPQLLSQGGGQIGASKVVTYVSDIGMRLAKAAEAIDTDLAEQNLQWEFFVLDSQVINAFALPGGKVFVSRGLMAKMDNEAQLAGVIGHEVGHVSGRHGNERVSKAQAISFGSALFGIVGEISGEDWLRAVGVGTATGGQLFLLKYSRSNELEADKLGVRYMAATGYNPVGQIQVMEILGKASGGSSQPEWLSTHPLSQTRIDQLNEIIPKEFPRYKDPGLYKWGFDSFKQNILAPLSDMPPAKHGASAFLSPAEFERIAGISWEQAMHAGCKTCTKPH